MSQHKHTEDLAKIALQRIEPRTDAEGQGEWRRRRVGVLSPVQAETAKHETCAWAFAKSSPSSRGGEGVAGNGHVVGVHGAVGRRLLEALKNQVAAMIRSIQRLLPAANSIRACTPCTFGRAQEEEDAVQARGDRQRPLTREERGGGGEGKGVSLYLFRGSPHKKTWRTTFFLRADLK